ncbi:Pentatricopeptide repeat-containing protein [Camellia lanceoleosa]|uniref:Pentatricopeptide repeat-containing protein n=1 Tax=Camellia lanceoleosa TaxID=1840588 RepID=A0ACC0HBY0_9ERIC|nr:Pentatricopeptide repeat-containing protein [Camellia lanceoleosa]
MTSSALPRPLSKTSITHHLNLSSSSSSNHSLLPNSTSQIHQWCLSDHSNHQISLNPPTQPKTIRYRLNQLCQNNQRHLAHQLFDSIPHSKTILWNIVMTRFVCNGMPNEAMFSNF